MTAPRAAHGAGSDVNVAMQCKRATGASSCRLVRRVAPLAGTRLLLATSLALFRLIAAADTQTVAVVRSSNDLYVALGSSSVYTVYLTETLRLDNGGWSKLVTINRNVTLAAHPSFQEIETYITLDLASLAARVFLQPGAELRFEWLELVNYAVEMGPAMLLLSASPGGRVVFSKVVQRRRAGLSGQRNRDDLLALPRLANNSGSQVAFTLPRTCYNSSREPVEGQCFTDLVYIVDVESQLGAVSSSFFAKGVALGEYDMVVQDSMHVVDVVVSAGCNPGASETDCVVQQLKLLEISPVIIKTKASDSNLVKIVAALVILAVSVLLFLYFRRHYRTYQQRRARRMRRIKEALGMGPEAHGIMFNGLDGEEPDWHIMPMPVGYAAEEGGVIDLQQDSNLRNLIKDISTRPNRRIPELGEGDEVRVDVMECPIAAEVGLRITPGGIAGEPGDGAAAAAAAATAALRHAGDPTLELVLSGGTSPREKGSGGASGPMATVAAVATIRPSGGSGTTAVSHRSHSASLTSGSRTTLNGLMGSPRPATAVAVYGVESTASPRHALTAAAPPTLGVTVAGMDFLLASRAAAAEAAMSSRRVGSGISETAIVATSSGGGGGGSEPAHSRPSTQAAAIPGPAVTGATQGATTASTAAERAPHIVVQSALGPSPPSGTGMVTGAAAIEGTARPAAAETNGPFHDAGGGGGDGPGAAAAAAAAANRHAVTFAAADVAQRVMKSKDSDDDMREEEEIGMNPQVTNLMNELEQLRRDIMAGINDTQLQIMSVVGSGAFGTVYRGQWQGLEVAVKTVVFSASSENRKRALQEAALCQSINHRNIVATYAVDVQPLGAVNPVLLGVNPRNSTLSNLLDWRLYIVQEYCDGGPLRKLVQSHYLQTSSGPNMPVICEVALELAQALAHLHSKNIIHGDLNPNNVLLKRDASSPIGFRVKMADFGLSVMVPLQKTHMSNLRLGTLYYIAPETCFRGQLGYAADVFSMGVMLWELYHGRLAGTRTPTGEPRYQPDFPDFPSSCPVDFRKLAHRCLQKQPHNRLHSSQVVQRLQEMIATYRASGSPSLPLPPLPLGGPDESSHRAPAPLFAQPPAPPAQPVQFIRQQAPSGLTTPCESRHRPAGAGGAVAATVAAAVSPEISPWAGGDSPRLTPARPERR